MCRKSNPTGEKFVKCNTSNETNANSNKTIRSTLQIPRSPFHGRCATLVPATLELTLNAHAQPQVTPSGPKSNQLQFVSKITYTYTCTYNPPTMPIPSHPITHPIQSVPQTQTPSPPPPPPPLNLPSNPPLPYLPHLPSHGQDHPHPSTPFDTHLPHWTHNPPPQTILKILR